MVDIAFWPETLERWRAEGLPKDGDPNDFFGLDRITIVNLDSSLRMGSRTLAETEDFCISVDENGVTVKSWRNRTATPAQLDFTLKTRADWLSLREKLILDDARLSQEARRSYEVGRERGDFITLHPQEPCWWVMRAMGHENGLMAMHDEPSWAAEMFEALTDFAISLCELSLDSGIEGDAVWLFSDLCYKNGMLFSPTAYRNLLMKQHRRLSDFCHSHGLPFILHCDGYVEQFVPLLIEAGFDCLQPLEARCGNDVRRLKKQYGDGMVWFGNISAEAMAAGGQALEEEVKSKVLTAKQGGGYIYHSDHSVPPEVSFENYGRTIELVREHGSYDDEAARRERR
jgi:uroporphyrinogen decarboxylase